MTLPYPLACREPAGERFPLSTPVFTLSTVLNNPLLSHCLSVGEEIIGFRGGRRAAGGRER